MFDFIAAQSKLRGLDWRDGRVAEGAPLLREYGVYSSIEGSNPSLSAILLKLDAENLRRHN